MKKFVTQNVSFVDRVKILTTMPTSKKAQLVDQHTRLEAWSWFGEELVLSKVDSLLHRTELPEKAAETKNRALTRENELLVFNTDYFANCIKKEYAFLKKLKETQIIKQPH